MLSVALREEFNTTQNGDFNRVGFLHSLGLNERTLTEFQEQESFWFKTVGRRRKKLLYNAYLRVSGQENVHAAYYGKPIAILADYRQKYLRK